MKKKALFTTALVAGALTFSGFNTPAQADETADQDYAKTVWGTLEPPQFDLDGDGWADGGFSTEWLPQDQKNKIDELSQQKDSGQLSQADYNEQVAEIFAEEDALVNSPVKVTDDTVFNANGPHQPLPEEFQDNKQVSLEDEGNDESDGNNTEANNTSDEDVLTDPPSEEYLADLALNSPEKLDKSPLHNVPYDYNFEYDGREFHFAYDGQDWTWSYDELENEYDELSKEELIDLVHNDPQVLNERPVKEGSYDISFSDDKYVYHFKSDGKNWTWTYNDK